MGCIPPIGVGFYSSQRARRTFATSSISRELRKASCCLARLTFRLAASVGGDFLDRSTFFFSAVFFFTVATFLPWSYRRALLRIWITIGSTYWLTWSSGSPSEMAYERMSFYIWFDHSGISSWRTCTHSLAASCSALSCCAFSSPK